MQKISSIHLNGKAYQLEEGAYEALRAYLSQAEAALKDNPDKTEVLTDLEQAIGEKCAACLNPNKDVVTTTELERILREMGPVEGASGAPAGGAAKQAAPPTHKRLYLIREGAMFAGVCTGLAAYFDVDVSWVRLGFLVLATLTGGAGILVYAALMFLLPYADTTEKRASAYGTPFNAQEIVNRAKESAARLTHSGLSERHQQRLEMRRQRHEERAKRRAQKYAASMGQWRTHSPFLGLLSALLAIGWIWALISLISTGMVFGLAIPAGMPLWVAILLLFVAFHAVTGPLRAARWHGSLPYSSYGGYPYSYGSWHAINDMLGTVFILIAGWFVYTHVPEVHRFVDHLPDTIRGWFQSMQNR